MEQYAFRFLIAVRGGGSYNYVRTKMTLSWYFVAAITQYKRLEFLCYSNSLEQTEN